MKINFAKKKFHIYIFYSRNSQAPGPVGKTVSIPLRKSGIPVDVDTPAPNT